MGPLLATKLYVPKLRRSLVARPRLQERLRQGAEVGLTLVCAPAGFGKTTLLAEWFGQAASERRAAAWLSLDSTDNDPAAFWTYLVTALRTAVPGLGSRALELLEASPVPAELVITAVVNDLAASEQDVWLVLDDYHLVDNAEISAAMGFLLDHLPARLHVVISTRADPDLPLSRWRVRGELLEIRSRELRFTPDEATAYLNVVTGLKLAADEVAVLEERTEGWIAALQLAALSLQGRDDATDFIARFAGDDRYIVDYLVEEVLRHQPDDIRDFLLHSAVLDRLTGPLCDAVTGRDDGSHLLTRLERANLFLVALDDHREWYRYHHLFADVLRARLRSEQPNLVPLLHQRASSWYERHDLAEEAITHALAASDFDRAASLMELAVTTVRRHRQEAMMLNWLRALPDSVVRRSPVLGVFYGYMLMTAGDLKAFVARLDDAEGALAAVPAGQAPPWADTEELRTLPATIAVYRAWLAQRRGDAAGIVEHAQRALDLAGPGDHLSRGGAAGFLGLAAWAEGDVSSAVETFTEAVSSLHAAGALVDELSSTVSLADMWLAAGRPSRARRLYQSALQVADAHGDRMARAAADLHVGISEIDVEVGDLESARRHLEMAATIADRTAVTERHFRWFVATALLARAGGDPEQAVGMLDRAEQLYQPGFFPDVRPIAALRARIWVGQGLLSEAAGWARDLGVSVLDDAAYRREFDHLTLVRLTIAQHRAHPDTNALDQAMGLLARIQEAADTTGRGGTLIEVRMLQALAEDARGQRAEALQSLSRAWTEAPEPAGYGRLFLDEGAPMMGLLRDAEHQGVAGDHTRLVLDCGAARNGEPGYRGNRPAQSPPAESPPSSAMSPSSAASALSQRELQVLRLLASELTGPEIARQLFISHNTLRTHTKHIFTKLDATNRRAAVRRAHELRLL